MDIANLEVNYWASSGGMRRALGSKTLCGSNGKGEVARWCIGNTSAAKQKLQARKELKSG